LVSPGVPPWSGALVQHAGGCRGWSAHGCPVERQLKSVEIGWRLGFEETIRAPAMHQIGADQSGEDERAVDGVLFRLGEAEQQKGDQRDGDLDAHGIFGGAEKAANFEGLLDSAEEQLDRPAPLVELGDLAGRSIEVVAQDAQHLAANPQVRASGAPSSGAS
jgi:hypothetical protein